MHDALRGVLAACGRPRTRAGALLALRSHVHRGELQRQGRRPAVRGGSGLGVDHSGHQSTRREHCRRRRPNGRRYGSRVLRERHRSTVGRALPDVRLHSRRAAGRREREPACRPDAQVDQRALDGRPWRHHHRHRQSIGVPVRVGVRADCLGQPICLGPTRVDGLPGRGPAAVGTLRRGGRDSREAEQARAPRGPGHGRSLSRATEAPRAQRSVRDRGATVDLPRALGLRPWLLLRQHLHRGSPALPCRRC
jgi:hypothetical protein